MNLRRLASGLFTLLLALAMVGLLATHAEARRLGGGKPMGRQSANVIQQQATAPVIPARPAATGAAAGSGAADIARKPWGSLLGGMAAGLGLAWLASSLGLGPAFANILLIALLAMAAVTLVSLLRRTRAPSGGLAYQGAGAANPLTPSQYNPIHIGNDASARPWETQPAQFDAGSAGTGESIIGSALRWKPGWGIPADFDVIGFTEAARRNFITLQDAWDRSDIPALRAMMTDEMLAEIQSQLAERERAAPGEANKTEVVMLQAQLLGIEELNDVYMASIEFSGMIREDPSAGPSPFREVWNMTKPKQGHGGWLVAGVQALQ